MQEENSSNYVYDTPPTPTPTPHYPTPSRLITQHHSKRPQELQHVKQQMDQAFAILQDMRKKDNDKCDLYGKLIAKKLRRIPESEREQLMYEIDGHFLRNNKRYQSLSYTDHSSSSRASSTCVLSPAEVHIQSPPSTVFPHQLTLSQPSGTKNIESFPTSGMNTTSNKLQFL